MNLTSEEKVVVREAVQRQIDVAKWAMTLRSMTPAEIEQTRNKGKLLAEALKKIGS